MIQVLESTWPPKPRVRTWTLILRIGFVRFLMDQPEWSAAERNFEGFEAEEPTREFFYALVDKWKNQKRQIGDLELSEAAVHVVLDFMDLQLCQAQESGRSGRIGGARRTEASITKQLREQGWRS